MITIAKLISKLKCQERKLERIITTAVVTNNILVPKKITKAVVIPAIGPIKLMKEKGIIKSAVLTQTIRYMTKARLKHRSFVDIIFIVNQ
ncbi:hypothetical protein A9Q74_12985 [Colwellia sp. 39_35_sub15_T18]|nr:hypothetical protein A9Q74_12985 [Colwellia sp. 39_35_sub15_T18]